MLIQDLVISIIAIFVFILIGYIMYCSSQIRRLIDENQRLKQELRRMKRYLFNSK